jgi:flagellar biosynthesis/type III secretory pathway M-ring protein FliF/YscJ
VPKQLLLLIGGMVVASMVVAAALIAFVLPSDILEPTTAQRAEEAAQAEAEEAEGEGDGEADEDGDGSVGDAEPGGEDTGDLHQEELERGRADVSRRQASGQGARSSTSSSTSRRVTAAFVAAPSGEPRRARPELSGPRCRHASLRTTVPVLPASRRR